MHEMGRWMAKILLESGGDIGLSGDMWINERKGEELIKCNKNLDRGICVKWEMKIFPSLSFFSPAENLPSLFHLSQFLNPRKIFSQNPLYRSLPPSISQPLSLFPPLSSRRRWRPRSWDRAVRRGGADDVQGGGGQQIFL